MYFYSTNNSLIHCCNFSFVRHLKAHAAASNVERWWRGAGCAPSFGADGALRQHELENHHRQGGSWSPCECCSESKSRLSSVFIWSNNISTLKPVGDASNTAARELFTAIRWKYVSPTVKLYRQIMLTGNGPLSGWLFFTVYLALYASRIHNLVYVGRAAAWVLSNQNGNSQGESISFRSKNAVRGTWQTHFRCSQNEAPESRVA